MPKLNENYSFNKCGLGKVMDKIEKKIYIFSRFPKKTHRRRIFAAKFFPFFCETWSNPGLVSFLIFYDDFPLFCVFLCRIWQYDLQLLHIRAKKWLASYKSG